MDDSIRSLLECVGESVVAAAWMCEPLKSKYVDKESSKEKEFSNMHELLSISHQLLLLCKHQRSQIKQQPDDSQKMSAFSSSDDDTEKRELMALDCTLAATTTRIDLNGLLGTNGNAADTTSKELSADSITSIAHKATIAATLSAASCAEVKMPSLSPVPVHAKFGAPFLQFLSGWSGLYANPWPFCNLGQARLIIRNARDSLQEARKVWGRETGISVENVVLDIAEADLEGGLTGGFVPNAEGLYKQSMEKITSNDDCIGISRTGMRLLHAHCLIGLARISVMSDTTQSEQYARDAIDILNESKTEETKRCNCTLICLYAWDDASLSNFAHSYHECASLQLVAESLIRSSRLEEARSFLCDAVEAAPSNFDAMFALASFHLRSLLFHSEMDDIDAVKVKTRNLLLMSAKMDKRKSSPFALLGVFYESQNDVVRAIGCYKKALSIDPSNPVSGRGLLRLVSMEEMKPLCEAATEQNSPLNGWAWRVIGQLRSWKDGNYSSAVICFQQALRCKDIQDPEREVLGAFYSDPKLPFVGNVACLEAGETWSELASCYRELGKWSGSFRAYHAASAVSGGNLSSNSLVAWAQVELELGMFEDAVQHCNEALLLTMDHQLQKLASFVKGKAILSISRQDIQEGKYGSCLSNIKSGLEFQGDSCCELKLLGDLCSVSEALPPYVFVDDFLPSGIKEFEYGTSAEVKRKLSLLATGASSYAKALELVKEGCADDHEQSFLVAAAATDLGSNLLAQARTISQALGDGSGGGSLTSIPDLARQHGQLQSIINKAINAFLCAIDASPSDSHGWCGLGCAIAATGDPLKAQHSFSRALQLDKANAEAWSNIGFLFTDFDLREKGSEILDALTQAEDTPFMWICRGFLFEKASGVWQGQVSLREGNLAKAADSYRAALQLFQHHSALLGLSLTCRRNNLESLGASDAVYSMLASESSRTESLLSVAVHQNIAGDSNHLATCLEGVTRIENGLDLLSSSARQMDEEVMEQIKATADSVKRRIDSISETDDIIKSPAHEPVQCQIDCDFSLPVKAKNTGKVPSDTQTVLDKVTSVISQDTIECHSSQKQQCTDDARNSLFLNPDSGEEWLAFAKALSRDFCNMESIDCNERSQALNSAKVAASRACEMLYDSVVHASMISPTARFATHGASVDRSETAVVSQVASATIVSEALALASWLEDLENQQTEVEGNASTNAMVTMQEAFLLDPTNVMASKALGFW
jgi:tetratricopeptide (TPR) repeat protein